MLKGYIVSTIILKSKSVGFKRQLQQVDNEKGFCFYKEDFEMAQDMLGCISMNFYCNILVFMEY